VREVRPKNLSSACPNLLPPQDEKVEIIFQSLIADERIALSCAGGAPLPNAARCSSDRREKLPVSCGHPQGRTTEPHEYSFSI
jgi:hypothetical protein